MKNPAPFLKYRLMCVKLIFINSAIIIFNIIASGVGYFEY